jgi:hypothetical protein
MVDKDKIMVLLKQYFTTTGTITIDDEGLVSCTGYVILRVSKHKRLLVSFDKIDDFFDCSYNQLTTLQGAPKSVSGDFSCHNNQLTTLEGAPQSVGGNFRCHINQLTTLEHSPQNVVGGFECYSNQLTTLEGAPKSVGGDFSCYNNQLTTLKHSPQSVHGSFDCSYNQLTTLEGAPKSVGGDFNCVNNKLATLEGMPDVQRTLFLSYRRKLPLLRCLLAKKVEFDPKPRNKTIETILNKYAGQGEAGAFACGAELAAAGFKANARW